MGFFYAFIVVFVLSYYWFIYRIFVPLLYVVLGCVLFLHLNPFFRFTNLTLLNTLLQNNT